MKRKRVFATLKVLGMVLEQLTEEIPEEVWCMIFQIAFLMVVALYI